MPTTATPGTFVAAMRDAAVASAMGDASEIHPDAFGFVNADDLREIADTLNLRPSNEAAWDHVFTEPHNGFCFHRTGAKVCSTHPDSRGSMIDIYAVIPQSARMAA